MEAQAKIEAQAALALAPPLAPVERLALEARCQSAMGDYSAAVRSYQRLWRISPEVAEYGFNVAEFQERSGMTADAAQTLQGMRKTRLSPADDARVDFAESAVRAKAGEYQRALGLVRQSEGKARRSGARYLYARARLREGGLLMNLAASGEFPALEEGLAICRAQGYRACEVNALRQEGNYFAPGEPKRAMELYGQGATIARQLGNRRGLVELLRGMAYVAYRQLLDNEAERRQREITRVIQDESLSDKNLYMVDLPDLLAEEGRLDEAERLLRQVGHGIERSVPWNLCLAEIERKRGEYGSAARRAETAVATVRKSEDRYALSLTLEEAVQIHADQGDLRRAAAEAQEVDRLRPFDPMAPYLRAELALVQAKWGEAESQAQEAIRRGTEVNRPLEAAIALVRAEAFLGEGRSADALRVLDGVAPALDRSRHAPLQIRARVCRLKAQALLGSCPDGAQIQALACEARRLGIASLERDVERAGRLVHVKCGTAAYAARRDSR
jgi:tetratricopeptide (TPR) repeat protein